MKIANLGVGGAQSGETGGRGGQGPWKTRNYTKASPPSSHRPTQTPAQPCFYQLQELALPASSLTPSEPSGPKWILTFLATKPSKKPELGQRTWEGLQSPLQAKGSPSGDKQSGRPENGAGHPKLELTLRAQRPGVTAALTGRWGEEQPGFVSVLQSGGSDAGRKWTSVSILVP